MRKNKNKLLYDFDHYKNKKIKARICLLYTSDAADE